MADFDAETLLEHARLIGLISHEEVREARAEAEDASFESVTKTLLRKGLLTSWQLERLQKEDRTGFFYGGCKVLFHLAEGTFARVYRGERNDSRRPVAIKVLRNRFVTDPGAIERFNKEAESGMKLRHPNIVQIMEYGAQENRHFMIMEYVEGSNLRDFLKLRMRVDAQTGLPLILGLARGLKYSHDSGVTHRDMKGTNILVSNSGVAKLVDFGLATIEADEKKTTMQSQRTVDYSALERTCGSQKGDPRSDIYFLGCVYYQMLTGQVPMPEAESKDMLSKMLKRSFSAIKPLSDQRHAPDPALCRIIERMMKVDLKSRYQTMSEVVDDLEAYESHRDAPQSTEAALPEFDTDSIFEHRAVDDAVAAPAIAAPVVPKKTVLCVEAQPDHQEAFRKTLAKQGYRVLLVGDAERAAESFREQSPDAVIFDADGLGTDALDAFLEMHEKAHEDEHALSALVLLGPKQKALEARLPSDDRLIVLVKPIKMKQVLDAIGQLAPLES